MPRMDLVYVYKRPAYGEQEIVFSLRSMCENFHFRRVYVIGDRPRSLTGFVHVPFEGSRESRYDNAFSRIMRAAELPEVSREFVLMNDDFFLMEPVDEIAYLWKRRLSTWIDGYPESMRGKYWWKMIRTRELTGPRARSFEVHYPIVYGKQRLLELRRKYGLPCGAMVRTLYCEEYGVPAVRVTDWKARNDAELRRFMLKPFLSVTDDVARSDLFMELMTERFPDPCRYES